MSVDTKVEYVLKLNVEELRLVLSALYGKLRPEQKEPALALQKQIAEIRAQKLSQMAESAGKYLADINEG